MLVKLQHGYTQLITSGFQLLLLAAGAKMGSYKGWLICLAAMAFISILAWLSALRRLRAVRDTPTSKIASAAQGYVELDGKGRFFGDVPLLSKLSMRPCLWYRYQVEQHSVKNKWMVTDSGESNQSFILRDETGECMVDPEYAEILSKHRTQWREGAYRYTEWHLLPNDNLYVLGQFRTQGGSTVEFNSREELNHLLSEWKQDKQTLHARFDLDNNGTLDMQEWMLARLAAKREVGKRLRAAQALPDVHVMCKPTDGSLFLISNMAQSELSRRYLFWAWAHLLIFLGAISALAWLLQTSATVLGLRP